MPVYVVIAYAVFILVPTGLSLSIALRRREVERQIDRWQSQTRTDLPGS
jgi:heme exporter protein CcmD